MAADVAFCPGRSRCRRHRAEFGRTRRLAFRQLSTRSAPRTAPQAWSARGEVAEWLKAHAWKVCLRETVTRVRIPLSPPALSSHASSLRSRLRRGGRKPGPQSRLLASSSNFRSHSPPCCPTEHLNSFSVGSNPTLHPHPVACSSASVPSPVIRPTASVFRAWRRASSVSCSRSEASFGKISTGGRRHSRLRRHQATPSLCSKRLGQPIAGCPIDFVESEASRRSTCWPLRLRSIQARSPGRVRCLEIFLASESHPIKSASPAQYQ